jgi:fibronectin-binding autotransporter adhesin
MKSRPPGTSRHSLILTGAIAAFLIANGPVHAANKTWDGGGANDNWLTGANWDLDIAPALNDALFFGGTTRLTPVNNFAAGSLFNGLNFNVGAGTFTLSGNGITLARGLAGTNGTVIGGNITNSSTNAQTISAPINLSTGNHVINTAAGSGTLGLSGAFTRSLGSTAIFTRTGGNINLSGSGLANDATGILGGWAVTGIANNSGDWATLDGSGNIVAYTGYTAAEPGGTINSGTNQNIKISTTGANITMAAAGTTDINTLLYSGTAATAQIVDIGASNTLRLGAKGAIMNITGSVPSANRGFTIGATAGQGTLTAGGETGGAGELFLYNNSFGGTNNSLTINASISDNGSGPVTVNIVGYVALNNVVNTYSGGTFINQGRIQAGNTRSFGTVGSNVTIFPGAEAFLNAGGAFAYNFDISGLGTTEANGGITGPGVIRLNNTANITGTIKLLGDSRISTSSNNANPPQMSGQITGTGNLELVTFATDNSNLILSNSNVASPNNWTGNLTISSLATNRKVSVRLGASDQIPDTANVTMTSVDITKFDLRGFNEAVGALNSNLSANILVVNGAATPSTLTVGSNHASGNFGGAIGVSGTELGPINLVKSGTGTQTLSGTNTYVGFTDINNGTLSITGSVLPSNTINVNALATGAGILSGTSISSVGNVIVSANSGLSIARIAPGANSAAGSIGTLILENLTINGGDLTFDLGGTSDAIVVLGAANFAAASTITPSSNAPNGTYTVLTAGTLTLGATPTLVSPTDTRKTFTADLLTPNTFKIVVAGSSKTLNWTGQTNGAWDVNTTTNWNDGAINEKYFNGDIVNFGDGPANRTLTLTGITVTPEAININNNAGDYQITGTGGIGGTAALSKSGTAKLTIATDNTYAGGTTISGGTVQVGNGGISGSLGTGAVVNDTSLVFAYSGNVTVPNAISGLGSLQQSGSGTVTLSGVSSYAAATTISPGAAIRITNAAAGSSSLGSLTGGAVTIASGAALDLSGSPTANALNFDSKQFIISGTGIDGNGAIVNNGVNQQNVFQRVFLVGDALAGGSARFDIRSVPTTALNATLDLAGHTLTKTGANQLSIIGASVSDGNIVVNQGILSLETVTAIPDFGTGTSITFNAGTTAQFFQVPGPNSAIDRRMNFNGITIINNNQAFETFIDSPVTFGGNNTFNIGNGPVTFNGAFTETGGARALTKLGTGTLVLAGANTYSGGTTIEAGIVRMDNVSSLGAATAPLTANGGTLDLNGKPLIAGALSGTAGTITNNGVDPVAFIAGNAADTTFGGSIQNAFGTLAFTKQGNGRLTLTGASTYSGGTTVNAGSLIVGGSLNGTSFVSVATGARLGGGGNISALGNVTLAAGSFLEPGSPLGTLAFNLLGGDLNLSGAVAGTGSLLFALGTTSDKVVISTGSLNIGSGVLDLNDFVFSDSGGFGAGTYVLFDGVTPISTAFGAQVSGAVLGLPATLEFADGNTDIILTVVPEPGTAATLMGGLGLLAGLRRRRR